MKLIKMLMLLMVVILIQTSCAMAAKNEPVRIVRLPIMNQSTKLDYDTAAELEMKLARAMIIPQNKIENVAEFVNYKEAYAEFNNIWKKIRSRNKNAKFTDVCRLLADKYNADLVVCPIINNYTETNTDNLLSSNIDTELIIFDRRTGNTIDKTAKRIYNSNYNRLGTASYLVGVCFDELIKTTNIDYIFRNIGK